MKIGISSPALWSQITIDVDKNLGGKKLSNCGDIGIGNNKLLTTDLYLSQQSATAWQMQCIAGAVRAGLIIQGLGLMGSQTFQDDALALSAYFLDGTYLKLQARDSGVGYAEIARLTGAALAYFNLIGGRARLDAIDLRTQVLIWGLIGG